MKDVERFERDGLVLTLAMTDEEMTITWRGTSDDRNPQVFLTPLLTRLAIRATGKRVTVDFRHFEYMNSSTVGPIIAFIKALDGRCTQAKLLYDTSLAWQRVNFRCMRTIARTLKNIHVEGA
ncbi:hypothetical protein LZC95_04805 [Pendulispora brunnea]|uniref:STAS domain-containing protein n=1 Tax=Pendulispora brunnea TaxID=2905690 RepID=A0ABZ2KII0_9BACT